MKLMLKVLWVQGLTVLIVLAADGWASYHEQRELFESDMERDAIHLGRALAEVLATSWEHVDPRDAARLIALRSEDADGLDVRWVPTEELTGAVPRAVAADGPPLELVRDGQAISVRARAAASEGALARVTYVPVRVDGATVGALALSEPMTDLLRFSDRALEKLLWFTAFLALFGGGVTTISGLFLIGRPMRRIAERLEAVGRGELETRLDFTRDDELGLVARTVDGMCDQLARARDALGAETAARFRALEQVRHADRLQAVGRLAAGVAHELGTPLNVVSARATIIAESAGVTEEVRSNAVTIKDQTARMVRIIRHLLDFARRRPPQREDVELGELVDRTAEVLRPMVERAGSRLSVAQPEHAWHVRADAGQIEQVLTNLMVNAVQAMPAGGRIRVGLADGRAPSRAGTAPDARWVALSVADDGEGMTPDTVERALEPFFTTKTVGQGSGLGLSIVHGIVEEHGGAIEIESEPGAGSRFTVYLPLLSSDEATGPC